VNVVSGYGYLFCDPGRFGVGVGWLGHAAGRPFERPLAVTQTERKARPTLTTSPWFLRIVQVSDERAQHEILELCLALPGWLP
jgi:hypothetical protein